jgi:1-aminocyclopropane-1-carboxylate deaminase/D-cysteine desulfhydrase-like pyridoxal-dependent ACC family enzyme
MKAAGMSIHDFERHPLTFGPSPVHLLDRLTQHLEVANSWMKREYGIPGAYTVNAYAGFFTAEAQGEAQ